MSTIAVPADHPARVLVSLHLNGEPPWLDPDRPVPARHVVCAAAVRLVPRAEVAGRLAELGYRPPPAERIAELTDDDARLLSRDLNGLHPWLTHRDLPVLRAHVLRAARRLGRPPAELADRLAGFGLLVPGSDRLPETVEDDDLKLVGASLYGRSWLREDDAPRLRAHLVRAAAALNRPPAELADRLHELGYRPPAPDTFPERTGGDDPVLVKNASGTLLADDEPVPLGHVLRVLHATRRRHGEPKSPAETADAVTGLCERFVRLGFRVAPGAAEPGADDLVLVSEGLDGRAPWLDAEQPVPLHHVLRFAQAHGRDPNEVVARLGRLGHRRLPDGPLPADSVRTTDLDLISASRDGRSTWLEQHDPEWLPHLLVVCVRTGLAPAEAADRLRQLGYALPEEGVPAEARESDLRIIGHPVPAGAGHRLSRTEPVPVGYVLRAAHAEGTNVASVVARLRELGFGRVPDLPDRVVTEDDLRIVMEQGDAGPVPLTDTVPYGRVVQAAEEAGTSVREAAERYRALGYTDIALPDGPAAGPVAAGATGLVRTGTGWLDPRAVVPPSHILRRAHAEGTGPAGIGRRLRALGYRLPSDALPETTRPDDLRLISTDGHGNRFLDPELPVRANDVRIIARSLGRGAYDVAERLVALGHTLDFAPHPDDALILSQNVDGAAPWVGPDDAGLGHVLLAAKTLGRSPAEIDERLRLYGNTRHEPPGFDGFDDVDVLVLSEGADARAPWLRRRAAPDLGHVLRAAEATGLAPTVIAERLTRLGHGIQVPATADAAGRHLLEALPRPDGPLRTEDVLSVVGTLGLSPAEVASGLTALGLAVPDVAYPDRRPAPTPPRRF